MHMPSEHTIDERRKDMELHIVHFPDRAAFDSDPTLGSDIFASVIGVLFTANKEEATALSNADQAALENFFESMLVDSSAADLTWSVAVSNLAALLDTDNKWTYVGSLTTPPCTGDVYWQVLSNVYYIPEDLLWAFWGQMENSCGMIDGEEKCTYPVEGGLGAIATLGNYRITQEVGESHRVRYVETTFNAAIDNDGLKVATAIMTVVSAVLSMVLVYCCVYHSRAKEEDIELAKLGKGDAK